MMIIQNYDSIRGFRTYCFRFGNASPVNATGNTTGNTMLSPYILKRSNKYKLEILINKYMFKRFRNEKYLKNIEYEQRSVSETDYTLLNKLIHICASEYFKRVNIRIDKPY